MVKAQAAAPAEPEARRDQVLRAAEALFARGGYHGVGLREIAARVGIRAPSLFKHFPSKHALYNAVLRNIFARLAEVGARLEGEGPFAKRLEAFVYGYVDLVATDPNVSQLLFRELMERSEVMDPETRAAAFEIYRRIDAFLEAGQRAGEFRRVDRFRFQVALTGAILYHSLAARPYAAILNRVAPPDRSAWKRTVLDLARGALLAPPTLSRRRTRPRR
ncbi:MAG TPA: TetR/AcrR family transcriptional regulator [Candidatus Dormibacteraeota bacterium]|nr:TetR/AcrR family transcriptional regulator [Candidatus Dormibacteraeota bacterium]